MTAPGDPSRPSSLPQMAKPPIWRDERFWKIFLQILAIVIVGTVLAIALTNMNRNLAKQGRSFEFGFLANAAGFNIGEAIVPFSRDSTYLWAFTVGLINSIRLILVSIPLATIFGVVAGIASFSDNWLLRKLSLLYVEVMRNIPILLVLFIWYFVAFFSLSEGAEVNQISSFLSLSKKVFGFLGPPLPMLDSGGWG
ncbi:MAG: ABC transporter permease subunit [Synechococcales cyanobacterium RU_4_20]|nr:ABC transporter permease subunit [Synechococcales cyanobacterium RU_4_20]NJR69608.1 ABC transporter permease subunit [Synechococcales cyanobacterium CRU_2_2]